MCATALNNLHQKSGENDLYMLIKFVAKQFQNPSEIL